MDSFNQVLGDLQPCVFSIQETKRKANDPPIKTYNLGNFQVFELKRIKERVEGGKGLAGGGLAIGAIHGLEPVLTRQGDDDTECMSMEIKAGSHKFLFVTGYGPLIGDAPIRKKSFWKYLSEEVKSADERNVGLIIQMDSNSWVGKEVIPSDPNEPNSNGKLMKKFLDENPALSVVNSLPCCLGSITRERSTILGEEKSILDVYIVCQKVLPLIKHMEVNGDGKYNLTNFKAKKYNGCATESDHKPVILVLDLTVPPEKPERTQFNNMKDIDGQMRFYNMTSNCNKLTKIFSTDDTFQNKASRWDKLVNKHIYQSFPIIRHKKRKFKKDEVGFLIEKRRKLNQNPESPENEEEIERLECEIVSKTEGKYAEKVKETIGHITGEDGRMNGNGVWQATKRIFPKTHKQMPTALKDENGNLITGHEALKQYSLKMMVKRLRKRPIHPNLKILEKKKTKLAKLRLRISSRRKNPKWSMKQMETAIKSMKNNKCRDPFGLISEVLKQGVAGEDYKVSLLSLINQTKDLLEIPHMMKTVNIAMMPKPGKRNLQDINNHRGVFLIHKYRSLLMRMLLNDKYEILDQFMSDSNIGGRKNRGIRDHLFIANGIIHEHKNSKTNPVTAQILDYKSCFDSMWLDEVSNDLFEAGMTDDKHSLLYKINETNNIAVKTSVGLSERKIVEKIVCQGDPWGSMQCSITVDGFGKSSLNPNLDPYKYKNKVQIPALGMVDDILIFAESGYKSHRMNAFINVKTAIKRLQFGPEKCHVMHIGKEIPEHKKTDFFVDGWKMIEVEDTETGTKHEIEDFNGEEHMSESENEKYLGQILSSDGTNSKNITYRAGKGKGMVDKVKNILMNNPGGKFHFEIAILMRNAYLISSMLSSSESWYDLREEDFRKLEQCDECLLRIILNCTSQVPYEILYLELAVLPARYIIMLRRVLYLQVILKQNKAKSLLYNFFLAQLEQPTKNDWVTQVLKDIVSLNLNLDLNQIESMTSEKYTTLCKNAIKQVAFKFLQDKKAQSKSVKHIQFEIFKMAPYLSENQCNLTTKERQLIFQCRFNDSDTRGNKKWKYEETHCITCEDKTQIESTKHILECKILIGQNLKWTYIPSFNELYKGSIEEQAYVSQVINENLRIRKKLQDLRQSAHVN